MVPGRDHFARDDSRRRATAHVHPHTQWQYVCADMDDRAVSDGLAVCAPSQHEAGSIKRSISASRRTREWVVPSRHVIRAILDLGCVWRAACCPARRLASGYTVEDIGSDGRDRAELRKTVRRVKVRSERGCPYTAQGLLWRVDDGLCATGPWRRLAGWTIEGVQDERVQ